MNGKLKFAENACIALLVAAGLLLAVSFLPFGGEKAAAREKAVLLRQVQELDSLPADVGGKIEADVKDDVREALYLAAAAKTGKEREEKKKVEVLVKASDDAESVIEKAGGEILNAVDSVDRSSRYFAVEVDAGRVAELASDDEVSVISRRGEVYPMLDSSVPVISAGSFLAAGFRGSGVKVAVLDTGIDKTHPMLKGRVAAERDFTGSGTADDECGHGTHVAGIIAGSRANGGSYDGVAPEAQLLNAKVLAPGNGGTCGGKVDYIIAALGWALDPDSNPATDDGAKVISMSLGGAGGTSTSLESELKDAVAKGAIVVVSSGNCGSGCPSSTCGSFRGVTWPGNSPSVITVGAVDDAKNVACFSSGENVQGVGIKPDFSAPGVDVVSSVPGGYESKQGTSMSAPHVSGAVALLIGKSPGISQGDVVRILEKTALDLGEIGKDTSYGFGLVDLAKAFNYREGLEVSVELEKQVTSGSAQRITVRVYDDVTVNSVKATITMPDNAKADVAFAGSGGNVYTYDYADTALLGNYVVDVAVNYGGAGGSSGSGSEGGGELGSGTGGSSSITVTRTAYFKVASLTGEFGNVEWLNVSRQQFMSRNLTANITFANAAAVELNFSSLLQLLSNGTIAQEVRLQPSNVAANSKATIAVNRVLDAGHGNYTLRLLADYGTGSLSNETNVTLSDDVAPLIGDVSYRKEISVNNPQAILVSLAERSSLGEVSLSPAGTEKTNSEPLNYTTRILSDAAGRKELAVTIFGPLAGGYSYSWQLKLCDDFANCAASGALQFKVVGCSGRQLLLVKTYGQESVFEAAVANSGACLSVLNKSVSGTPPPAYLDRFDAVVWSAGADLVNVDYNDAASLIEYYSRKGKVIVEGSDVAFRHGNDDFIRGVLRSELKTDLGFTVSSVAGMGNLSINLTRPHPIFYGLPSPLAFNATLDPFPDAVRPYNGSVELAAWSGLEAGGSAAVAYESGDGGKKSLLLPFSIAALNDSDAKALASGALKWLLEDSSVDIEPLEIKYGTEYPLIAKKLPPGTVYCIAVCYPVWELAGGACRFNPCGSSCGIDNLTSFVREEECELAKGYYAGSRVIVEGEQFTASSIIASTEKLASPLRVRVLVDGAADGVSEGDAVLAGAADAGGSKGIEGPGGMCGGIAGFACPEGMECVYSGGRKIENYPDEAGKCVEAGEGSGKGDAGYYNYSYNFTARLGAGQHAVTLVANSGFSVAERNYLNNLKSFSLSVYPKKPDLVLSGMAYAYKGGTLAISFNASNLGGTEATAGIAAYLGGAELNKAQISPQVVALAPGESAPVTVTQSWYCPFGEGKPCPPPPSMMSFAAEIDPDGSVDEHNESNNELSVEVYLCSKQKVLVVDDNDAGLYSTAEPGSAAEFVSALRGNGYCVSSWSEAEKGTPPLAFAKTFQAMIWSAGDYFGNVTSDADIEVMVNYGSGLLLEGSDIAMEMPREAFLNLTGSVFSQDMLISSGELVFGNHSLTNGTGPIRINSTKSPYPDGVEAVNSEVVAEWQNGSAAITAARISGRKSAYYSFSVDAVSDDSARERLIINTVEWLLQQPNRKPSLNVSLNSRPLNGTEVAMNEGETASFSAAAEDPDGDSLDYAWLINGTLVSSAENFTLVTSYNGSGDYNLTIEVSDGQATASLELTIIVLDTMDCGAGQRRLCQLQQGVCENSFEVCSEGKWRGCSAKDYGKAYEATELSCDSLDNDCDGIADEGRACNTAPVIRSTLRLSVKENERVNLILTADDAEGDSLNFSSIGLPEGASLSGSGVFTWTPSFEQAGAYPVRFSVSDGALSSSGELVVTVLNVNRAPLIDSAVPSSDKKLVVDEGRSMRFEVGASDPDGDKVIYRWKLDGKEVHWLSQYTYSPGYTDAGEHVISVSIDDRHLSDYRVMQVTVRDAVCANGETKPCELQSGVCSGKVETCTNGEWRGCSHAGYGSGYEKLEKSCDGLDNDCDGSVDEPENLFSQRPCGAEGTELLACVNGAWVVTSECYETCGRLGQPCCGGRLCRMGYVCNYAANRCETSGYWGEPWE